MIAPRRCSFFALLAFATVSGGAVSQPSTAAQQEERDRQTIRQRSAPSGIRTFKPGVWGTTRVEVVNSGEEIVEVVTGGYSDGNPLERYSRQIQVPAGASRFVRIPTRPTLAEGEDQLQWRPFLSAVDGESRQLLRASDDYMIDAERLSQPSGLVTAVIDDWNFDTNESVTTVAEFVVVFRLAAGYTRSLTQLDVDDVPSLSPGLNAVDHAVLTGNRVVDSPAAVASLRRWVQNGGRLWIPLDQVDLSTVQRVVGDVFSIVEVDRIRLTGFQLYNVQRKVPAGRARMYDEPVDFVRVLVDGVTVLHEIDGWPASFSQRLGDGIVMVTTLSDRGWYRHRHPQEFSENLELNSYFISEQALDELASQFTRRLDPPPVVPEDFERFLSARIGYNIPGRGTILSILGLFCVALVGAGVWLQRSPYGQKKNESDSAVRVKKNPAATGGRRLEKLAFIGPLLALITAAPIVVLGERAGIDVPAGASVVEIVRVGEDNTTILSTGATAVYVPRAKATDIEAHNGRLLLPKADRMGGTVREMVWTDIDAWHWANFNLKRGIQFFATHQSASLDLPVSAEATLGPNGLIGSLNCGPYVAPSDPIIASTSQHAMIVTLESDGRFTSEASDLLEPGIYIGGNLLTDQQRQRHSLFQLLLAPRTEYRYPRQPVLLVWTTSQETGLTFPDEIPETCSSLLAVPLKLKRTLPGTDVFIPSPLLPMTPVMTEHGNQTTAFDARTGQWVKTTYPTDTLLRFDVPESVLPLNLTRAEVYLRILAPGRRMTIEAGQPGSLTMLVDMDDAAGDYDYSVTDTAALQMDENGAFYMRLAISPLTEQATSDVRDIQIDRSWKMEFIRLELFGHTADEPAKGEPHQ